MTPAPRAILRIGVMRMPDREKVIKGLEYALEYIRERPNPTATPKAMAMDGIKKAIAMLKEQETDAEIEGGGRDWWYVCGECRAVIDSSDSYCSKCGRRIRWKRLGGDE